MRRVWFFNVITPGTITVKCYSIIAVYSLIDDFNFIFIIPTYLQQPYYDRYFKDKVRLREVLFSVK